MFYLLHHKANCCYMIITFVQYKTRKWLVLLSIKLRFQSKHFLMDFSIWFPLDIYYQTIGTPSEKKVYTHCGYGIFWACSAGTFLLCQTFWSKYLWIFLAIYVDYSYFDAQVRCTYLVPNMTLTLMFNRNYNNLRYSIKKMKSLLEQKFFLLKTVCEFSLKHWQ